ncbi:hypothetical protein [Amycolatopsis sp. cmx-11-32]|uniref:hypothetical protein n=1 Tax=Amycolatopsis sp. cmx-11-32 TaxID=2785796 RepID=UPI0039E6E051
MTQTRNANRQARVAANKIRYTVITLQQPQHAEQQGGQQVVEDDRDEDPQPLIAARADNPFLEKAYRSLGGEVQRFRFFAKLGSARGAPGLVAGERDETVARMRRHIKNAKQRVLKDRKSVTVLSSSV